MVAFRINRTNDAVFKAVFAKHPQITISLINAFFEFQGTELIEDIEFIDREMDADEYEGKESRLDILGRTASGTKVNIEMQVNALAAMGGLFLPQHAGRRTGRNRGFRRSHQRSDGGGRCVY